MHREADSNFVPRDIDELFDSTLQKYMILYSSMLTTLEDSRAGCSRELAREVQVGLEAIDREIARRRSSGADSMSLDPSSCVLC